MQLLVQYALVKLLLSRQLQEVSVAVLRRPFFLCSGGLLWHVWESMLRLSRFLSLNHNHFSHITIFSAVVPRHPRSSKFYGLLTIKFINAASARRHLRAMRCSFVSRCRLALMKFVRLCVKSYHFMVTFTFKNSAFISLTSKACCF